MGNPSTTTTTATSTVAAAATAAAPAASRSLYLAWTHFQRRQVSMADLAGFECVFLPLAYKGRSHLLRGLHYLRLMLRTVQVLRQHRPRSHTSHRTILNQTQTRTKEQTRKEGRHYSCGI